MLKAWLLDYLCVQCSGMASLPTLSDVLNAAPGGSDDEAKLRKRYRQMKEKTRINIVVAGKTGVGKSTLINSLFGKKMAEVSSGPDWTKHEFLEEHEGKVSEVPVTIYDTRGLSDTETNKKDLIKEFEKTFGGRTEGIDLLLICHEFFGRFDKASKETLEVFANAFLGPEIWKRTIFVLTKANNPPPEVEDADDPQQLENIRMRMRKKCLDILSAGYITSEIASDLPFVPAGYYKEGSKRSSLELATTKNWLEDLLRECVRRCQPNSTELVLKMTWEMFKEMVGSGAYAGMKVGASTGAIFGAFVGTVLKPGSRTVFGTAAGAVVGGSSGAATGAVGMSVAALAKFVSQKLSYY